MKTTATKAVNAVQPLKPELPDQPGFTPGEWKIEHNGSGELVITKECRDICTVETYYQDGTSNARLIAAAPDLYVALDECLAWFELDPHRTRPIRAHESDVGRKMVDQAQAALAKALGR